jgi:signal transduction histidine kinase
MLTTELSRRETASETGFLKGMFDGMRCGIVAVDRAGRVVLLNDLACQILELREIPGPSETAETVLGCHPSILRVLHESYGMSSLPNRAEMELDLAGGRTKTIGFTVSMVPGQGREADGVAVFFKDLTQIEHKEEQERLKDRLAALGQMAASMAHEIRNPLASIDVTCALLRRRLDAGSEREMIDKISAEVRRLNQTITASLEFVRPVSLTEGPADINPLIEQALDVAVERHGQNGIQVERELDTALPAFRMDRDQIRQVFENLALNALQAMGSHGTLRVSTESMPRPGAGAVPDLFGAGYGNDPWHDAERIVVIRVADTGPGISEEERDKVLYPFYTTKKQGSGIGLSMAKKIIDSHRGMIDIERSPQGGALFSVRLPMVIDEAVAPEGKNHP